MDQKRDTLLKQVMAADFTIIDLNLYLNTHPNDQRAVALYNNAVRNAKILRETFEKMYGPLTAYDSYSTCPWRWIENPWPWDRSGDYGTACENMENNNDLDNSDNVEDWENLSKLG